MGDKRRPGLGAAEKYVELPAVGEVNDRGLRLGHQAAA
jgi:hypothetical protein